MSPQLETMATREFATEYMCWSINNYMDKESNTYECSSNIKENRYKRTNV